MNRCGLKGCYVFGFSRGVSYALGRSLIPGIEIVWFKKSGHTIPGGEQEKYIEEIEAFIKKLEKKALPCPAAAQNDRIAGIKSDILAYDKELLWNG